MSLAECSHSVLLETSACSALQDETDDLQWMAEYSFTASNGGRGMQRSILNMDLSYEDFSKNMDANLAQIDMETFRSEDINTAILSLAGRAGEECASLSGSLIDDLPMDSSQRVNEICRRTPLFSPLKEPCMPSGHVSTDSLDCSEYHGDLVLTCQATNKNNYTLAFEQSVSGQISDESSDLGGSSDGTNWPSDGSQQINKGGMVHSEFAYTTWSRVSDDSKPNGTPKSHSLPDLLRRSFIAQHNRQTNTLYTINDCQVIEDTNSPVPLLRMFMDKGKSQDMMNLSSVSMSDSITIPISTLPIFNAGQQSSGPQTSQANNMPTNVITAASHAHQTRARQNLDNTNNNNNVLLEESLLSEEDNSQCFEDSLVGMLSAQGKKLTLASPIGEEEEPLASSCDEPMKDVNSSNSSEDSRNLSPYEPVRQNGAPSPKVNNFVGGNKTPPKLTTSQQSMSSGYIGRQNSNDQINKASQAFLLSSGNRRAVSYVTPEQLATGGSSQIKNIYVCYPNYSLPDLSFLKDIKPGHAVVLQPTEIGIPSRPITIAKTPKEHVKCESGATPSRRRALSSDPKCRPKSYNDYETLIKNGMDKIQDWESLSLLLPDDIKLMVKQIRGELTTPPAVRMRDKGNRQPRPLRIDQICSSGSGSEESSILIGQGNVRRHSLLNLPSLTGLIPTGLDLNAMTQDHSQDSDRCICRAAKKAVSFSDNLNKSPGMGEHGRTPATCGCRNFALNLDASCSRPRSELTPQGLSPSGFISPLTHSQHDVVQHKRKLLDNIYTAIRLVVSAYGRDKESDPKMQLLNDDSEAGIETLKSLLPSFEEFIGDGLLPHVRGLFGPLPNSKWHLVESMVQTKEGRQEIRELLDYIHSVNNALDENQKFKCFTLGLINLGCVDTWITLLLATSSIQHKHYTTTAFIPLLSHYSFFFLQEELVSNLRILSELPFAFNLNLTAKMRNPATIKGRARPVSYPAAVKKEPEPPKKDVHKFRQLRTQWERISGVLPNRPTQQMGAASNGNAGNSRIHHSDNLRKPSTRMSRPVSSPQKVEPQAASASNHSGRSVSPQKLSRPSSADKNVVVIRKSLIPIRGWSNSKTTASRK